MARKKRSRRRSTRAVGAPPGSLTAPPDAVDTGLRVLVYDSESLEARTDLPPPADGRTVWVDAVGLGDVEEIRMIGERFGLHPLALEDVMHPHQRAKVEAYEEHLFVVAKMIRWVGDVLTVEQVSFFVGADYVVSFQEREGDCFDSVRRRLHEGRGRLRRSGAPYLAYALLDSVVDHIFPVLEVNGDRLEDLEERIFVDPDPDLVRRVHEIKRDLVTVRRAVWPLRDTLSSLYRGEHPLMSGELAVYLRDAYDHAIQVVELVEGQRELASSLLDAYLSGLGYRQNEVMKVLTMVGAIFIPLSFLAGLYGMNFDTRHALNMPELSMPYAYPVLLGVMAVVVVAMLAYFRRKGWL